LEINHCYSKLRDLEYKTAIVTGSGRGIGKETAILLSRMGLNVVICSRTQKEINSTVKEIKEIVNTTNKFKRTKVNLIEWDQ
jgi:short-subunit dehydrogenase